MMNAGKLRRRVAIQKDKGPTDPPAPSGETVERWETVDTVWASIEPLRAREFFDAAQTKADTTHLVRLRYSSLTKTLTAKHRIKCGSKVYYLQPARNLEMRDRELEFFAVEKEEPGA